METLIVILLITLLLAVLASILVGLKNQKQAGLKLAESLMPQVGESVNQQFQNITQQLVLMNEQALKGKQETIASDLANKEKNIQDLVKRVLETVDAHQKRLQESDVERVGSFRELKNELEQQRRLTEQLKTTTENLRSVLSNNQARGAFGEQVADDLLRMAGFREGIEYEKQTAQGEGRPDFSIMLPDKMRINIDVKFPYKNLLAFLEAEDPNDKKRHIAEFKQDIKAKIKQVVSREYINPGETVDFVILFIPNEMIFSFVYEKMNDVWDEAMRQKVVLAGPFSFTAILRLVKQAHKAFKLQADNRNIINAINNFEKEFNKYSLVFEDMGKKLQSVTKTYDILDTTRRRQLQKTIDVIQSIDEHEQPSIAETTE